jgi:RNA polymerase sigma factor (sigma-70 family)
VRVGDCCSEAIIKEVHGYISRKRPLPDPRIEAKEYHTYTDQKLWELVQQGDLSAFRYVYDTHIQALYAYGKKLSSDEMLLDDSIQEVFITIWKNKASIHIERSILFYFIRSLRRRILKDQTLFLVSEDPEDLQNSYTTLLSVESRIVEAETLHERSKDLKKAINLLSKRQKEALHLRYFQDLSYEEIGRIMDLNTNSLYKLVSATIKKLRENIRIS